MSVPKTCRLPEWRCGEKSKSSSNHWELWTVCSRDRKPRKRLTGHNLAVYKIGCTNCSFVYYGQTVRSLKTRITEHKRAVFMLDHDSKISCHIHENNHKIDFGSVRVVGHEANFHEQLFLETWMSIKDSAIWKWLNRHPRGHTEFSAARVRRVVFWITRTNVSISTDEGSSTSRNVLNKTSKK